MSERYSTCFSFMVLAGTSVFCIVKYHCNVCGWKMACATFIMIAANSILGTVYFGNPDQQAIVERPYKCTEALQTIIALPFVTTQFWLECQYQEELALTHSIICLLPFHLYLADKTKPTVIDLIIAANGTSLGIVAFLQENYNGVAAAIAYMFTHFFLREGYFDSDALSITDIRNYGLSSFCLLALHTLKTKKGTC